MPRYSPADLAELHDSHSLPSKTLNSVRGSQETLVVDPRCRLSRGSMIDAKVAHVLRLLMSVERTSDPAQS